MLGFFRAARRFVNPVLRSDPSIRGSKGNREGWNLTGDTTLWALADGGVDAVRVEALAKALGVTKGGFYGYFADRDALLEAMLDTWERESVDDVLDRVEREDGDAPKPAACSPSAWPSVTTSWPPSTPAAPTPTCAPPTRHRANPPRQSEPTAGQRSRTRSGPWYRSARLHGRRHGGRTGRPAPRRPTQRSRRGQVSFRARPVPRDRDRGPDARGHGPR